MRIARILSSILALTLCVAPLAAAQGDRAKLPKKGDVIAIKGCLRGNSVEDADTMRVDAEGETKTDEQVPVMTYRLGGDKKLLKQLKDKHDRRMVEIKGVLRSEIATSGFGKDVGRTRISIGVDPKYARGAEQPLPVLEATSFEGTTVSCK